MWGILFKMKKFFNWFRKKDYKPKYAHLLLQEGSWIHYQIQQSRQARRVGSLFNTLTKTEIKKLRS